MNATIGDGMQALALAGGIVGYVFVKYRSRQQKLQIIHQERMAAMEKQLPLPEFSLEPAPQPCQPNLTVVPILGTVLLTLSLGAMIVLYLTLPAPSRGFSIPSLPFYLVVPAQSHGFWASPLPFALMGVGLIALHFSTTRTARER